MPQDASTCLQDFRRSLQDGSKMPPRRPKMPPRRPKMHQDAPKMPQDASKMPPRSPKMPPRCPKMPPRCPNMPLLHPGAGHSGRCGRRRLDKYISAAPCLQQGCRGMLNFITDTYTDTEGSPHTPHCPPPHRVQPSMFLPT